jgi:flagellar motility protein MotE (MotC chaperone)
MKKIIAFVQVLVFLFFALKIAGLAGAVQKTAAPQKVETETPISRGNYAKITDIEPSGIKGGDELAADSKTFLRAVEDKQKTLDKREVSLKLEEQRLVALKNEILEKIELLKAEQEKFNAALSSFKTADTKRYKDLAKVFDSTPPAKAGAMLEIMDTKTAAGITMNMKKEKAGALWGYITPQKAIEITQEITRINNEQ